MTALTIRFSLSYSTTNILVTVFVVVFNHSVFLLQLSDNNSGIGLIKKSVLAVPKVSVNGFLETMTQFGKCEKLTSSTTAAAAAVTWLVFNQHCLWSYSRLSQE